MKDTYKLNNYIEELDESRKEYNQDMLCYGIEECILNNDTFSNTVNNIDGIDKLRDSQVNDIINNTLLTFENSFNELAKNSIFEFDTFVSYQTLICNLIIEKIRKAIDNI